MMNQLKIFQVDSFADQPFQGNPAAVCLLESFPSDAWMQSLAAEMNLSETAFVCPATQGFHLRWFTPSIEVDLCGHATLAAAHVLWESGALNLNETASFQTLSGNLMAEREGDKIILDFPSEPALPHPAPAELLEAVKVAPRFVGKNRMDYIIEVGSTEELANLSVDYAQLSEVAARGVIVTTQCHTPDFDFLSRFFCPAVGVNEDPVTGSAHCCLAPYWAMKLGRDEMRAFQASRRGGVIDVQLKQDRVRLGGNATTIFSGDLQVAPF